VITWGKKLTSKGKKPMNTHKHRKSERHTKRNLEERPIKASNYGTLKTTTIKKKIIINLMGRMTLNRMKYNT
jgi:hypothetical protein